MGSDSFSALVATPVRTIADLIPNLFPFLAPRKWSATAGADFLGQIGFPAHLGHSHLDIATAKFFKNFEPKSVSDFAHPIRITVVQS